MTLRRDILLTLTGAAMGVLAKVYCDGSSKQACSSETEKSSTRETATQTSRELHSEPRPPNLDQLKKKNEELRQRIQTLTNDSEALKLERDYLAARESTANGERDKAVRAMNDAFRAEERAHRTIDLVRCARDDAIQSKNEAVRGKNDALRVKREAVRAEKEAVRVAEEAVRAEKEAVRAAEEATLAKDVAVFDRDEARRERDDGKRHALRSVGEATFERDLAIADRDEAIQGREKSERRVERFMHQLQEQTKCTLETIVREKADAVFARDQAKSTIETMRLALVEQMTEVRRLRQMLAAIVQQNSLRSITMNPPQ